MKWRKSYVYICFSAVSAVFFIPLLSVIADDSSATDELESHVKFFSGSDNEDKNTQDGFFDTSYQEEILVLTKGM